MWLFFLLSRLLQSFLPSLSLFILFYFISPLSLFFYLFILRYSRFHHIFFLTLSPFSYFVNCASSFPLLLSTVPLLHHSYVILLLLYPYPSSYWTFFHLPSSPLLSPALPSSPPLLLILPLLLSNPPTCSAILSYCLSHATLDSIITVT